MLSSNVRVIGLQSVCAIDYYAHCLIGRMYVCVRDYQAMILEHYSRKIMRSQSDDSIRSETEDCEIPFCFFLSFQKSMAPNQDTTRSDC